MGYIFTVEEVTFLEDIYQKGYKNAFEEAKSIAERLGHTERRIKAWFSCRKKKDEKVPPKAYFKRYFNETQRKQLEIAYRKNQRPGVKEYRKIAKELDVEDMQRIKTWFAHRQYVNNVCTPYLSLNKEQRKYLLTIYVKTRNPRKKDINEMAATLGVGAKQVNDWFVTKRAQAKKRTLIKEPKPVARVKSDLPVQIKGLDSAKIEILEAAFQKNTMPTSVELQEIKEATNIKLHKINIWFNSRQRTEAMITGRVRRLRSKEQQAELEKAYQKNKYITGREMTELGDRVGLLRPQTANWFRHQRLMDKDFDKNHPALPVIVRRTPEQILALNEAYNRSKFIKDEELMELANRTGIKELVIKQWFLRKRCKDKDYDISEHKGKLNAYQVRVLQTLLEENPSPSTTVKKNTARMLGVTLAKVTGWIGYTKQRAGIRKPTAHVTTEQKNVLLDAYNESIYASNEKITDIADRTGLTEKRIKCWFATRRSNEKAKRIKIAQENQENKFEDIVEIKEERIDQKMTDAEV